MAEDGGESDLLELVERAIDALATGLRELEAEAPERPVGGVSLAKQSSVRSVSW